MARSLRTLSDLGESALIRRIARRAGRPAREWLVGIGDDAAILRPGRDEDLVFSTDVRVEGVHFRFGRESPRVIGRSALAVNLSDLAAMGAEPVGTLLSLCAPGEMTVEVFDGMVAGFVDEARRFACPLVGGNLSRAESCNLTVTVIGRCARGRALGRSGLRVGDVLYVTGLLGAAALARLRADREGGALRRVPTPRLEAGRALAALPGTRACIDLSDGLTSDLGQLLTGSTHGVEVEFDALPTPRGFSAACRKLGLDPAWVQTAAGEDYELLFVLDPKRAELDPASLSARLGVPVARIGQVVGRPGIRGLPPLEGGHHF
jgi:thiamine-monophosphate kinase